MPRYTFPLWGLLYQLDWCVNVSALLSVSVSVCVQIRGYKLKSVCPFWCVDTSAVCLCVIGGIAMWVWVKSAVVFLFFLRTGLLVKLFSHLTVNEKPLYNRTMHSAATSFPFWVSQLRISPLFASTFTFPSLCALISADVPQRLHALTVFRSLCYRERSNGLEPTYVPSLKTSLSDWVLAHLLWATCYDRNLLIGNINLRSVVPLLPTVWLSSRCLFSLFHLLPWHEVKIKPRGG